MKNKKILAIFISVVFLTLIISIIYLIYKNNSIENKIQNMESNISRNRDKLEKQGYDIYDLQQNSNTNNTQENTTQNNTNTDVSFENPSVEGLLYIPEDKAKEIWENYRTNTLLINDLDYVISQITIEDIYPNNYLTSLYAKNNRKADFTRKAYVFKCDMNNSLEHVVGYIDIYTGKVLGGYFSGV